MLLSTGLPLVNELSQRRGGVCSSGNPQSAPTPAARIGPLGHKRQFLAGKQQVKARLRPMHQGNVTAEHQGHPQVQLRGRALVPCNIRPRPGGLRGYSGHSHARHGGQQAASAVPRRQAQRLVTRAPLFGNDAGLPGSTAGLSKGPSCSGRLTGRACHVHLAARSTRFCGQPLPAHRCTLQMRLTKQEQVGTVQAARAELPAGSGVSLCGFRVHDRVRVGDIELLVKPDAELDARQQVLLRMRFAARLHLLIGKRRIDTVLATARLADNRLIVAEARRRR